MYSGVLRWKRPEAEGGFLSALRTVGRELAPRKGVAKWAWGRERNNYKVLLRWGLKREQRLPSESKNRPRNGRLGGEKRHWLWLMELLPCRRRAVEKKDGEGGEFLNERVNASERTNRRTDRQKVRKSASIRRSVQRGRGPCQGAAVGPCKTSGWGWCARTVQTVGQDYDKRNCVVLAGVCGWSDSPVGWFCCCR